jgi:hypothetical protein
MQLRSGRSIFTKSSEESRHSMVMRRDSRNYEEYAERLNYQREQRMIEESIYTTEEEEINNKKKRIINTAKHLLYAIEYQTDKNFPLAYKVKTCIELYRLFNNNMPFLIEHNVITERLAKVMVDKGTYVLNEIWRKDKTRNQKTMFNECRYIIGNVIDLIEHHVLKLY